MESSLELPPSASSLRRRSVCRGGPRAPRLAGSFEPGLAASRRGRLRVLYESPFRALSLGLLKARPRFLPRGPSRPAAGGLLRAWLGGFSPWTSSRPLRELLSSSLSRPLCARPRFLPRGPSRPAASGLFRARLGGFSLGTSSRPLREPLSSSLSRPLRCEAEVSAVGALTPRGWRALSSPAWRLVAADAFASFMESTLGLSLPASSLRGRYFCRSGPRALRLAGSFEPGLAFLAAVALESFVEASSRSGLRVIFIFFRSVLPVSSHPQPDLGDF